MLKTKYYCLTAGLPDLFFDENKPGFNSLDFRNELEYQLEGADFELIKLLFLPFDNENFLNHLFQLNKPFNKNGLLPKNFMDADLEYPVALPTYMNQFINWMSNQEENEFNIRKENRFYGLFYDFLLNTKNNFLHDWFTFEINIKNILTAINCRRFNYEIKNQLIKAGRNTSIYSQLKNTQLKHEHFYDEVPFAEQIFRIAESELSAMEKEKSIDKIKWDYVTENTFFHYFTIEKTLSFLIKLMITERWINLDETTGKELLNQLINEINLSYEFPTEFSLLK